MVEWVGDGVEVLEGKSELHACAHCSDARNAARAVWLGMDTARKTIRDLIFWV